MVSWCVALALSRELDGVLGIEGRLALFGGEGEFLSRDYLFEFFVEGLHYLYAQMKIVSLFRAFSLDVEQAHVVVYLSIVRRHMR